MRRVSRRCWMAGILCSMAAVMALSIYLHWPWQSVVHWRMLTAAVMLVPLGAMWFSWANKREKCFGVVFGGLFVLLQLCGERVTGIGTIAQTGSELVWLASATAALAPAAGGVFALIVLAVKREQQRTAGTSSGRLSPRTVFWGSAAVLLLCWLPYLLAFYPGLFTYDISWQYQQYQEWNLNTHHPLVHTLLVGGFCELGWHLFGYPAKGLLMYTVFQMAVMALAMASAIRLLHKYHAPSWICCLMLIADAVLPFNTLLVISSTKDTLFAGAVLYLSVLLLEAVLDQKALCKPGWMIRFVLAETAVGLLRNNGFICIASVAFMGLIWLVRCRQAGLRLLALSICGLIAYTSVHAGLKQWTGAENGHFREMLSVPLQQLARVHSLTDDEAKPEIQKWLPTVELYSPDLADMVKNTFEGEKEDLPELIALWTEVGLRHPVIYMDSFLVTGAGFYHLNALPTGQYAETRFHEDEGWWLIPDSKWPSLRDKMARLYSNNEFLHIPLYSRLLSPALWVWVMLVAFFTAVCRRNRAVVLSGMASVALYLTVLLSPCVMMRYVYPIMLTAPLLLGALMIPTAPETGE